MSENCPHCRTFAAEAEQLHREIVGYQAEILKKVRENAALRGQLTKQRRQEDVSRHVMAVLRVWRSRCSPRASIAPSGKNADHVRTALLHYTNPEHSMAQRRRLLYDAVRGAALRPYDAGYGRRTANAANGVRRVTTEHIFASESRIEALAGYYRMAQAQPLEWKMKVWEAAEATAALWRDLAMQEMTRTPDSWRIPEPANPDHAEFLFLDERPQEPVVVPVPEEPRRLFVIEGGQAA
jgi:hypothetical protein